MSRCKQCRADIATKEARFCNWACFDLWLHRPKHERLEGEELLFSRKLAAIITDGLVSAFVAIGLSILTWAVVTLVVNIIRHL